jgi:flavodoxin I
MKLKLIFGSDTGNTDYVVETYLLYLLNSFDVEVTEVHKLVEKDWIDNSLFILGVPTWYDGVLQSDWEDYFDEFKKIDFTEKTVAIFGLGDQIGYDEYFVDGIGILAKVILENGGKVIGNWPTEDYSFAESKALVNENYFYGIPIDQDNEDELTLGRLERWVEQLKNEIIND